MNPYKYIDMVGVELEGLWHPDNDAVDRIVGDGSVCNFNVMGVSGEIPIGPFLDFRELSDELQKNYPDVVNSTCGMHVHVSLKNGGAYETLADERFRDYMVRVLTTWGKLHGLVSGHRFWKRMRGGEHYCDTNRWSPQRQMEAPDKCGERYAAINFCWRLHGTVEFRVLPMFHKTNTSLRAIRTILNATDRYLRLPSSNTHALSDTFALDAEMPDAEEDVYEVSLTYGEV